MPADLYPPVLAALFGSALAILTRELFTRLGNARSARRLARFVGGGTTAEVLGRAPTLRRLPRTMMIVHTNPGSGRAVLVGIVVVGLIPGIAAGWTPGLVAAAIAVVLLAVQRRRGELREDTERQAPAAVAIMANGIRAGYSIPQAIALVARESPEPTASQYGIAQREIEIGVSFEEALSSLARRTGNLDYDLVSIVVSVQHETGGSLVHALNEVGETLRERLELRQQVAALTAQQRLSSIVLTILPIAIFFLLLLINRPFVDPLLTTVVGRVSLALVGGMLALAWVLMRSLGRVEV